MRHRLGRRAPRSRLCRCSASGGRRRNRPAAARRRRRWYRRRGSDDRGPAAAAEVVFALVSLISGSVLSIVVIASRWISMNPVPQPSTSMKPFMRRGGRPRSGRTMKSWRARDRALRPLALGRTSLPAGLQIDLALGAITPTTGLLSASMSKIKLRLEAHVGVDEQEVRGVGLVVPMREQRIARLADWA